MIDTVKPDLCLYHAFCQDGFAAAWAVWKRFGDDVTKYVPVNYGEAPPDVTGKHVVIVDFSYKKEVLLDMSTKAKTILVLDHHRTAMDDLSGIAAPYPWPDHIHAWSQGVYDDRPPVFAHFDMEHSGAVLAWNYFHEGSPPPLLKHVQDRDLWRFKMPGTREIHAVLSSLDFDFTLWSEFVRDWNRCGPSMHEGGAWILRANTKTLKEMIKATRMRVIMDGHDAPIANLPPNMASEAGHIMCEGELFAVTYTVTPEGVLYSLRSTDAGLDVSEIAKKFGGGGHRNAAGFKMVRDLPTFNIFPVHT